MTTACEQMSAAYERGRMSRDAEVAQLVAALKFFTARLVCACTEEGEVDPACHLCAAREFINAAEGL